MLVVLLIYLVTILSISFFVGRRRSEENNNVFFTAERKSNWLAVSFGMVGATISGISVVSVPGQTIGNSFFYMQMVFGFIVGYIVVAYLLLPVYYKLNLTSIYQILGMRFGPYTQKTASLFFLLYKLLGSAVKLYVVILVLDKLLFPIVGISFEYGAALIILMIYLYTFRSGVGTVVITDCLQTLCLVVCVSVLLYQSWEFIGYDMNKTMEFISTDSHCRMFQLQDASSASFFVKQFLSGVFIVVLMTGLDQDVMQKNLTCKDLKSAQKNMVLCGFCFVPVNFILLLTGAFIVVGMANQGLSLPEGKDALVPFFVNGNSEVASICLLIGLLSASLSSADSALVGLTTSFFFDFRNKKIDEIDTKSRYIVHFIFAVILFLLVCAYHNAQFGSALDIIYNIVSYIFAPMLGLFVFAIWVRKPVMERNVPLVMLLTPIVMFGISLVFEHVFNYYFGYELIAVGALFTLLGLFSLKRRKTKMQDDEIYS